MKAREARELTEKELREKIAAMEDELFNLRFQAKMGQLVDSLKLRIIRKDIARAHTVLSEKTKAA